MHNASLRALGEDAIYLAFDVAPDCLMQTLPAMAMMGFGGVNLTVPLKEVARRGLERLDESALLLGAVNTIEFDGDGMIGHNTDGYGFVRAVSEAFDKKLEGCSIFIVGCGGAGRAVALTCAVNGAQSITLSDIDRSKAERLRNELADCVAETSIAIATGTEEQTALCREAQLVVQASPVGMNPGDPSLLEPQAFTPEQFVFDLIYMYPETPFLKTARTVGAQVSNGLGMLLHQGARAYEIWTGQTPDTTAMRTALEEAVYSKW